MGKFRPSWTVFLLHLLQYFNLKKNLIGEVCPGAGLGKNQQSYCSEDPSASPSQGSLAYEGCDPKPLHGSAGPLRGEG